MMRTARRPGCQVPIRPAACPISAATALPSHSWATAPMASAWRVRKVPEGWRNQRRHSLPGAEGAVAGRARCVGFGKCLLGKMSSWDRPAEVALFGGVWVKGWGAPRIMEAG